MYRFFSFAVLFNWLLIIAMIGMVGLGISDRADSLMASLVTLLSSETPFALPSHIAESVSIAAALCVLTAGLWAIMAVLFADGSSAHNADQDFVVTASLGFCLIFFAILIVVALSAGSSVMSAGASVASLATVLAGISHRMFSAQEVALKAEAQQDVNSFSLIRAQSMASQSANLATAGARSTRFVPKRHY